MQIYLNFENLFSFPQAILKSEGELINLKTIKASLDNNFNFIVESQIALANETESMTLNRATVEAGVSRVFEEPKHGSYYVGLDEERTVGTLLTTPEWSDWRNKTCLWIQSVYVLQEYRNQGVYKSMYAHIKNLVEASDEYCGIKLYVDKSNSDAINVYRKLGMDLDHYQLGESMKS